MPQTAAAISFSDANNCWRALMARDARADGQFVYAVRSTGIYCRPSCPARRPLRANVRFFANATAAEQAGFRACLRCQPRGSSLPEQQKDMIIALCREIAARAGGKPLSLDTMARRAKLSRWHFLRAFKSVTGVTPKAYQDAVRADAVRDHLRSSKTITQAAYDAGYETTSAFYDDTQRILGMTPQTYRKHGQGETIHFALGSCSLGEVLVAMSDKGICAILLGNDAQSLLDELQERFNGATLIGGARQFETHVAQIIGLIDNPTQKHDLPLDIRGTAFQRRVWDALRKIRPGTTLSYSELAQILGAPKSVRAVASACAANAIAIVIPCHRVVRVNGDLAGYRWGIERKRQLLTTEKAAKAGVKPTDKSARGAKV